MELGVFIHHSGNVAGDRETLEKKFHDVAAMGFPTCQLQISQGKFYTEENAIAIKEIAEKYNVRISAFWCMAPLNIGPCIWHITQAPRCIGLVPPQWRAQRIEMLLRGCDFAKAMGVQDVVMHVGYVPEYPASDEFQSLANDLKYVAQYFKNRGQYFLFETGQETPIALLRLIETVGIDSLGINLDPSNLITGGKGNPIDALTVFGQYVRGVHAKDGKYPTFGFKDGTYSNGVQVPLGEGHVDYPRFLAKLREIGYDGPLTIEREISGEQQRLDIIAGKAYLETLL
ncbi:MAG: sugar phosphate isomerase/epimerase [Ruminococcaceae bacterium]|nr:sugar phosphate isomerase/epimerase [Oscillospiraceae bacterium]